MYYVFDTKSKQVLELPDEVSALTLTSVSHFALNLGMRTQLNNYSKKMDAGYEVFELNLIDGYITFQFSDIIMKRFIRVDSPEAAKVLYG